MSSTVTFGLPKPPAYSRMKRSAGVSGLRQRQPVVFVDQLAAGQRDFKPVGAGRLARAGDERARRAAGVFDVGRHVVLNLDVVPAAKPAERAHADRHAADPLPQIEVVRRLIEQNAAAVRRPRRAPRTGIVITLRAQPIGDDDAGALDARPARRSQSSRFIFR